MESSLAVVLDLWNIPQVQNTVKDTARIFFTSSSVTINLVPALLAAALGLGLLALIALPLLGGGGDTGASYGSNLEITDGYGASASGYNTPASGYDAPASGYDAPANGYEEPSSGYDAPTDGYSSGRRKREVELAHEAIHQYTKNVAHHLISPGGDSSSISQSDYLLHARVAPIGQDRVAPIGQDRMAPIGQAGPFLRSSR